MDVHCVDEEALTKPLLLKQEQQPAEMDGGGGGGQLKRGPRLCNAEWVSLLNVIAFAALVTVFHAAYCDRVAFCQMVTLDPELSNALYMRVYWCEAPFLFDGHVMCSLLTIMFFGAYVIALDRRFELNAGDRGFELNVGRGTWWGFWFSILLPLNYQSACALVFELSDIRMFMPAFVALVVVSCVCVLFWAVTQPFYVSYWCPVLVTLGYMSFFYTLSRVGDLHIYSFIDDGLYVTSMFFAGLNQLAICEILHQTAKIIDMIDDDDDDDGEHACTSVC